MIDYDPDSIFTDRYAYVDEAGDPTLYGKDGKPVIGTSGCSAYFMVGLLTMSEMAATRLQEAFDVLRHEVMTDPYLEGMPSLAVDEGKTAKLFHACKDCPEVRERVYRFLQSLPCRFYAVVCDKKAFLARWEQYQATHLDKRYTGDQLYDSMVKQLFRGRTQSASTYQVAFARRGKSNRDDALRKCLAHAQYRDRCEGQRFCAETVVRIAEPHELAGLQAVDYYLWATQRTFERGDDRYLRFIWPNVERVVDRFDRSNGPGGTPYTQEKPLTAAALSGSRG